MTTARARTTAFATSGTPGSGLFMLVLLWAVWGTSWPAMRVVFTNMPVWQFRAVTCVIAGLALIGLARLLRARIAVPRRQWGILTVAAMLNITSWHILVGYALIYITAGQAVIVCYTLPVWTAILAAIFLKDRITARTVVAVVLGLGGLFVLLSADLSLLGDKPLGLALVFLASICWAGGTVLLKKVSWTVGLATLGGWQLLIAAVPITVVALAVESFEMHRAPPEAIWASVYVLFIAIIAGYALWFRIVEIFPAMVAAIGALVIPVIGVLSGALVLGEPLTWREGTALLLVLGAVALVVFRRSAPAGPAESDPADR